MRITWSQYVERKPYQKSLRFDAGKVRYLHQFSVVIFPLLSLQAFRCQTLINIFDLWFISAVNLLQKKHGENPEHTAQSLQRRPIECAVAYLTHTAIYMVYTLYRKRNAATKPVSRGFFPPIYVCVQGWSIADYSSGRYRDEAKSKRSSHRQYKFNLRQYFFARSRNNEFWISPALLTAFKCSNNTTKHCTMRIAFIFEKLTQNIKFHWEETAHATAIKHRILIRAGEKNVFKPALNVVLSTLCCVLYRNRIFRRNNVINYIHCCCTRIGGLTICKFFSFFFQFWR